MLSLTYKVQFRQFIRNIDDSRNVLELLRSDIKDVGFADSDICETIITERIGSRQTDFAARFCHLHGCVADCSARAR